MSTSGSDAGTGDSFNVRLSWPGGGDSGDPDVDPQSAKPSAAPFEQEEVLRPAPIYDLIEPSGGALRRLVVDSYDRLAERVIDRLRLLREDVDADLAEVRSEMAALRQAVEDLSDRVQLRQMRALIDELRSDVAGLRRAVLEWPELERVSGDVTALRADVADLIARPVDPGVGAVLPSLAPLLEEVVSVRADLQRLLAASTPESEQVMAEVAALREEIVSLRRRISLRVESAVGIAELSDDQIERVALVVAERVREAIGTRSRR